MLMFGDGRLGAKAGDLLLLAAGGFLARWFWHDDRFMAGAFTYMASTAFVSLVFAVFKGSGIHRRDRQVRQGQG